MREGERKIVNVVSKACWQTLLSFIGEEKMGSRAIVLGISGTIKEQNIGITSLTYAKASSDWLAMYWNCSVALRWFANIETFI